ncbi:MAG: hypothetical protein E6L00_00510 [Thaumarchaeota archaeon]|nr:MAG: hypothetical protein E6L00_00510 [Nitrososphaerota archaeon]
MKRCCKKAERELKEAGLGIVATSVIWGWVTNDLHANSVVNTIFDLTKSTIMNDKQTQKNIGTFVACHLGL